MQRHTTQTTADCTVRAVTKALSSLVAEGRVCHFAFLTIRFFKVRSSDVSSSTHKEVDYNYKTHAWASIQIEKAFAHSPPRWSSRQFKHTFKNFMDNTCTTRYFTLALNTW